MAKNFRRMFAMVLVLCMTLSALPMQALAAEEGTTTTTEITEDGVTTEITATTTTSTDSSTGNVTVTVDIQQTTSGTSTSTGAVVEGSASSTSTTVQDSAENVITHSGSGESTLTSTTTDTAANTTTEVKTDEVTESEQKETGETRDYQETTTTTTTTDANGNVISEKTVVDGSETKEWTEDVKPGDDVPSVDVILKPNETVEESISKETEERVDNIEGGSTANNSDTTITTTVIDRDVTATVGDITTSSEQHADTELEAVGPEDYEGKVNINSLNGGITPETLGCYDKYEVKDENGQVIEVRYYPNSNRKQEEYDLLPDEIKAKYQQDADGIWKPIDENGNFTEQGWSAEKHGVWWDYVFDGHAEKSTSGQAIANYNWHDNSLFVLYDKAGNRAYAYCMDAKIGTDNGIRYAVENLDEADYFKGTEEEQADTKAHIRAIALNGYWGTEEGTGSLKNLTDGLKAAFDNGFEFVFSYTENGVTYAYDSRTEEGKQAVLDLLVANINEGDALVATQGSFWSFGREDNNWIGFNPYRGNSPNGMEGGGAELRMELIKAYLTSDYLKDKVANDSTLKETTIIDDGNFLADDGLKLTVGDKVSEGAIDEMGKEHDIYNVDLSFTMVVEPSTTNGDDLIVTLLDNDGNIVRKARLAGDSSSDDASFTTVQKNGSTYTFTDLQLAENSDFKFDLQLNGWQNLKEGVYMYKATAGYDKNQTLVGLSSGSKEVDVTSSFTLSFNVDEEKHITTEHVWHTESDPVVTPPDGNEPTPAVFRREGGDPAPQAQVFRLNNQDNLEEIPEEPVPLATPVVTGDNSSLWIAVVLMSVLCMVAINVFDKKKQHEAF